MPPATWALPGLMPSLLLELFLEKRQRQDLLLLPWAATITKKYQLVFVTGEVAPFSKTGGLGEAMDGLPIALAALGHRCMVISPRYDQYKEAWDTGYWGSVTMGGKQESVHFFHTYKQKVDYVFVDHPTFLERVNGQTGSKLYGPEWGKDFADNQASHTSARPRSRSCPWVVPSMAATAWWCATTGTAPWCPC
eukprot:Skav214946  [mRNA]  locus=scaffold2244:116250:118284:+ [translate_table: standard]